MMSITHAFASIAIAELLMLDTPLTLLGGIMPDIDYLLGIEHRTVMHSLIFIIVILFFFYKKHPRKTTSFTIGYLSHLVLDVITTRGIMLLYPWQEWFTLNLTGADNQVVNVFIILLSVVVLWNKNELREMLRVANPQKLRMGVYILLITPLVISVPVTLLSTYFCEQTTINTLLAFPDNYDEKCVIVHASICSGIEYYTAQSGYEYQIFDLCNESRILVWKTSTVKEYDLAEGQRIRITGIFTNNYLNSSGYELYKIKSVSVQ